MKKIQKSPIFILTKQEVLKVGDFLPFNMENSLFSMPFKTRSFEGSRKFLK